MRELRDGPTIIRGDGALGRERLAGLRAAFLVFGLLGFAGFVVDILDHALAVYLAGCTPILESFITCSGRPFHLAILTVSGLACCVGGALLVGRIAAHLIDDRR